MASRSIGRLRQKLRHSRFVLSRHPQHKWLGNCGRVVHHKLHSAIKRGYALCFPCKSTPRARLMMKKFGLFIGVDRYRELNAPNQRLECAGADATALAAFFRDQLGFHTALLLDKDLGLSEQGSHEAIFEQLNGWQASLQHDEEHLLLLYFAGHGSYYKNEQFLLAPKAPKHSLHDPADGELGIVSENLLKRTSARWPNVQRVFIFDACRAQLTAPEMAAQRATIASRVALGEAQEEEQEEEKAPEPNLLILRACAPQQLAFELRQYGEDKKNHGLFTAALLAILQQRLADEQSLELNDSFCQLLHAQMQQLAKSHAPPKYQAQALAQRPYLHGKPICLLTENEVTANRFQRVLAEFAQRFSDGHYHEPTVESCAESLRQLRVLKYPQEQLHQLGQQLDAAVSAQRLAERRAKGEKLIALARRTQSPEAYLKLLEQEFHEYEAEVEQFFATRDAERSALQARAASAEKLAEELRVAKQEIENLNQAKRDLQLELLQTIRQMKDIVAENDHLKQESSQKSQAQPAPPHNQLAAPAIITSAYKIGAIFQEQLQGGTLGPQMVVVPAGSFQLGSDLAANERFGPQVTIAQPFAIGKFPVTVEEYLAAVDASACRVPHWLEEGSEHHYANGSDDDYRQFGAALYGKRFPIVGVSRDDALAYLAWLNSNRQEMHGLYRLPSEAEWEYAARAGNAGQWCFGDVESRLKDFAWYDENSESKTHEVGGKQANTFGLHDMHGNVWELVADEYHQNYLGAPKDGSAWQGSGTKDPARVLRGGSWYSNANIARSAFRNYGDAVTRFNDVGFRVARTLPSKTAV